MVKYQFPENFMWGSAASGPQTEGRTETDGKGDNIWDFWYHTHPEKFFDEVGPDTTSDFYNRYPEYIQLMKQTGHNSYRHSIQWSRLIPDGDGEVNDVAVNYYNNLIDELIKNDIEPMFNLYHFDMPLKLQEQGGWENRHTVDAYVRYAKICFELFGDRVKYWFTHNEPIVPVEGGYLYQFHYPAVVDMKRAVQVGYNELIASAKAIEVYHNLQLDGKIGIILNLTPSYPKDPNNEADVKAAKIADAIFNRSFLDPSVKGEFPTELLTLVKERHLTPAMVPGDMEIIQNNTIDFLGINYYQPRRVQAKMSLVDLSEEPMPEDYFDNYEWPERKMNPYRGWEIYEKGIYDILTNVRENYGNIPCYISENGMGVEDEKRFLDENGMINDDYRIEFIKDHLRYVHQAITEGTDCRGYHLWTCMDNWSWLNAYKNRYGLIAIDLDNDLKATIKKSGYFYAELAKNNGFDD